MAKLVLCVLLYFTSNFGNILALTSTLGLNGPSIGLADISDDAWSGSLDWIVAAYGDFNADKLTDIFLISSSGDTLSILFAHKEPPLLRKSGIECQFLGQLITSVVPGDFDGDNQMDVLITTTKDSKDNWTVLWGGHSHLNCSESLSEPMIKQPFVFDYNFDRIPDIMGHNISDKLTIWKMSKDRTAEQVEFQKSTNLSLESLHKLRFPHSNAIIDLDHDFAADLILTTTKGHVIYHNRDGHFIEDAFIPYQPGFFGQSSYLDIDADNNIAHIVPFCESPVCRNSSILILQKGINPTWETLDVNFVHDKVTYGFYRTSMQPESADDSSRVIWLRVGDVDLDGFPDLVVLLHDISEKTPVPRAFLLHNVKCSRHCSSNFQRTFEVMWNMPYLSDIPNVVQASFFDFYNDGILDVILQTKDPNDKTYKAHALKNLNLEGSTFVKVMVLSGICYNYCPDNLKPYGVNQPGPFVSYRTHAFEGTLHQSCAGQLYSSAYYSLQLPFIIFGLGQTPNFVEDFKVGIPSAKTQRKTNHLWNSIIPNSHVVVIPQIMNEDGKWLKLLFVTPSELVLLVFYCLLGTCCALVVVIITLYIRERIEDKKEKQKEANRFHFDAM